MEIQAITHRNKDASTQTYAMEGKYDPSKNLYFQHSDWARVIAKLDAEILGIFFTSGRRAVKLDYDTRTNAETWKKDVLPKGMKRVLPTVSSCALSELNPSLEVAVNATKSNQVLLLAMLREQIFGAIPVDIWQEKEC
jgi:hypothetical protein